MSTTEKMSKFVVNEKDTAIRDAVNAADHALTLAELREVTGIDLKTAHIAHALKGKMCSKGEEIVVSKDSTKEASTWVWVSNEQAANKDGSVNYNEKALAVMSILEKAGKPMTLADISKAYGEKVAAGVLTSLIKKGNLAKGETIEVPCVVSHKVGTYLPFDGAAEAAEEVDE